MDFGDFKTDCIIYGSAVLAGAIIGFLLAVLDSHATGC